MLVGWIEGSLPTGWNTQTESQELNALAAKADGIPDDETNCIRKGKTGTFKVNVSGTPPFLFNICFSDRNGRLLGGCLKLEVASFAAYPAPSAEVTVTQRGKQVEFEARPELESFIQSMSGRLVTRQEGSAKKLNWSGLSAQGKPLAKGVYMAVVTIEGINGEMLRKVHKFVER